MLFNTEVVVCACESERLNTAKKFFFSFISYFEFLIHKLLRDVRIRVGIDALAHNRKKKLFFKHI